MSILTRALGRIMQAAISRNPPGPYRGGDDDRWAYTIVTDGDPYLSKIVIFTSRWLEVYLHHFHRKDLDRAPHNHPWRWALSLLLSGAYDEERTDEVIWPAVHRARARLFNFLTSADYHKVERLHGEVWTLFITGPRIQGWGFLVDGEHVPWTEYLRR